MLDGIPSDLRPRARLSVFGLAWATLMLVAGAGGVTAQDGSISGMVVVETGQQPLAGAQVLAVGTDRGTVTDGRGRFLLTGLSGTEATIRVVMIGYRTQERTVPVGASDVMFAMQEVAIELDRVVVTGTTAGAERRRQIGNAVSTVNASDIVEAAPVRNMQEMLNGRAAGVFVVPSSGMVGGGQRIRIRGTNTFSLASDPLIYVDGVRVNNESSSGLSMQAFGSAPVSRLNDFNPEDIESIEILKGPAAATLYGTEASRGVINIITRRGRSGETTYNFTTRQGASWFSDPAGRLPTNYWRAPSGEIQSLHIHEREKAAGRDIFRTGRMQGYTASVSGGSGSVRYFVSGDYDDDEGIDPTNDREQFSARANLQFNAGEHFDLSVSTGYVTSDTRLACEAGCGGRMWGTLFASPALLPENCVEGAPYGCGFTRGFQSWPPEPHDVWSATQGIHRFTGSVTANWRPFSWMTNRFTVGRDITNEDNLDFLPYLTSDTMRYFWGARWADGYRYQNLREAIFDTYDYTGTVNFDIRPGLTSATSVGLQYYKKYFEYVGVQGEGFPGPGITTVDAAANKTYQEQAYWDNNTLGVYLQEQVGWEDRLFVTAAMRIDNNSAFGSEVDFVVYPKASVSWVLHEEPFFQGVQPDFLSTLRLRAAYGESGQQPELNSALRTYVPVSGPDGTSAVTPNAVGNPDLKPERGREIELGFDAGLFDDRIGIDFTYYRTNTKDAILSRPVPPSTGFPGSQWVNAGEILNTGLEAQIRGQVVRMPNLGWDLTLNLATNGGEVRKLAGDDTTLVAGSIQHRIGRPAYSWFRERVVSAEFDPNTGWAINAMCDDGAGGTTPCYNEFGVIVAPRVYLGRTTPSFEASLTSSLSFLGNFRLHAMVDYKSGFKKWDNNLRIRCQIFGQCHENVYPETADPAVLAQIQSSGTLVDFVINDASFARLREVALEIEIPRDWVARFGASNASLNIAGRNLHTWTDYTGLDPEVMFLGGSTTFQFEQDQIPHPMQFVTTVNVSF